MKVFIKEFLQMFVKLQKCNFRKYSEIEIILFLVNKDKRYGR